MIKNELKVQMNSEGTVIRIDFDPARYSSSNEHEQTCFGKLKELAESFARRPRLSAGMYLEDLKNGRIYIRAFEDAFCPKWVARIMKDTALEILRETAS